MNPKGTVGASWLAMLTVQTIGSITPQKKLPAPKQYVAISVVWSILYLMVDTGAAKLAARLSLLILLTAAVVGPFGKRFVVFLEYVAKNFSVTPQVTAPSAPAPGTYTGPVPPGVSTA